MTLVWARRCAVGIGMKTCLCCFSLEGDVYKAQTPSTETQGAPEVREDKDVQVEVPVDQVGSRCRVTVPSAFFLRLCQPRLAAVSSSPDSQAHPGSRLFSAPSGQ